MLAAGCVALQLRQHTDTSWLLTPLPSEVQHWLLFSCFFWVHLLAFGAQKHTFRAWMTLITGSE